MAPPLPAVDANGSRSMVATIVVAGEPALKTKRKSRRRSRRTRATGRPGANDDGASNRLRVALRQSNEHPRAGERQSQSTPRAPIVSNIPFECPACRLHRIRARHPLYRCRNFREYTLSERSNLVYRWNLCELCLNEGHDSPDCDQSPCPRCNGAPHNSVICPRGAARFN